MIEEKKIDAPIIKHVYKALWQGESAKDMALALMALPMMEETHGLSSP